MEELGRSGLPFRRQHVHPQDDAAVGQNFLRRQTDLRAGTTAQETRHGDFEVVRDQVLGAFVVQLVRDVRPAVVDHFVFLQNRSRGSLISFFFFYG